MAKVTCEIEELELENETGHEVPAVIATCSRCGHETTSFGTGEASRKRCLALMGEQCPEDQENYYVEDN